MMKVMMVDQIVGAIDGGSNDHHNLGNDCIMYHS